MKYLFSFLTFSMWIFRNRYLVIVTIKKKTGMRTLVWPELQVMKDTKQHLLVTAVGG